MNVMIEMFDIFARLSVFYLFNGAWVGCVVAVLVLGLLRIFRQAPAVMHYRIIWFGLVAILVVPFFLGSLGPEPALEVRGVRSYEGTVVVADQVVLETEQVGAQVFSVQSNPRDAFVSWPLYVVGLWLIVSGVLLVRLISAAVHLHFVVRSGRWENPDLQTLFETCKKRWTGRDVRLRFSKSIRGPMAVGVFNPMILLPERLVRHLSKEELEKVLVHELAHIDRQDIWSNWVQHFFGVFLWFNPAIWILSQRLTLTREMACDDWAVRFGQHKRPYVLCLARLAELMQGTKHVPAVGLGVGSSLKKRIEYLLNRPQVLGWFTKQSTWIGAVIVLLVSGFCLQLGPLMDVPGRAEAHLKLSKWNATLANFLIGNPLPRGIGLSSKIVVVAEEAHWEALKPVLTDVLLQPILTPQPESVFNVVYVSPDDFDQYRVFRNVIIVGEPHSKLGNIVDDLGYGQDVVIRNDVWAINQVVIGIRANDVWAAKEQIALNADRIVSVIDDAMADWLTSILYHAGVDEVSSRALLDRHGWQIQVPVGFKVMHDFADQKFITFARQIDRRQLWMWVYWEDGVRPDQLTADWCLEKRNEICRKFYDGDQTALSDLKIYETDFNSRLAVCLEGLWENDKSWQGGPFKNYALVDADRERFYMIDVGIYAPSRSKALHVRQLDALAHTFEIPSSYVMK